VLKCLLEIVVIVGSRWLDQTNLTQITTQVQFSPFPHTTRTLPDSPCISQQDAERALHRAPGFPNCAERSRQLGSCEPMPVYKCAGVIPLSSPTAPAPHHKYPGHPPAHVLKDLFQQQKTSKFLLSHEVYCSLPHR